MVPARTSAHLDLDAVGVPEQQLDRGDGLDLTCVDLAAVGEVGGDAALGEPRQRELAADEDGHGQAEEGEHGAQHRRLRLDGGAQQGSGPLSLRALAAVARQPASRAGEPPGHGEAALDGPARTRRDPPPGA